MKRIAKYIIVFALTIAFVYVSLFLHSTKYEVFNFSSIKDKCILCNFENRHHCNLCKSKHRQCPFCDNIQIDSKK